jgi:predicted RNase H-like HicB family nuclease
MKRNNENRAKHYLQQPYARIVIPVENGGYHAEILEFMGCYAQGESPEEAYKNLEEVAETWIEACLDRGQEIPEPSSSLGYAGNVLLRLPRSIHRQASKMAQRDRTSLNQYLLAAVSARVGADELYNVMSRRLTSAFVEATHTFCSICMAAAAATPATFQGSTSQVHFLETTAITPSSAQSTGNNPRR